MLGMQDAGCRRQDAGVTKLLIKKIKCQVVFVERIVSGSNGQQTEHPNMEHCHCYKIVGCQNASFKKGHNVFL